MTLLTALGLMSGTSCDGIDAAILRTDGEEAIEFIHALPLPYAAGFRNRLLHAAQHDVPVVELLRLEKDLTELHAGAVRAVLKDARFETNMIDVIGFHGHTLRHVPDESLTLQIGDPSRLAEAVGAAVVSDFRRRDLAAGGQGAPLAPRFHQALFRHHSKPLAVLNLGGVSNITWLGENGAIAAFDAGPGCGLLDAWTAATTGASCDLDGRLALAGNLAHDLVERALSLPYFARRGPKSADRFEFAAILTMLRDANHSPQDGAATLCAITAEAIWRSCSQLPEPPHVLWIAGGGAKHPLLMRLLADRFANVRNIADAGLRPDSLEAECFAWLAVRRLRGLPTSLPATTGCRQPTCGGLLTHAAR